MPQASTPQEFHYPFQKVDEALGAGIHHLLPGQEVHSGRSFPQRFPGILQRQGKQNGEVRLCFADPADCVGPLPHDRQDGALHRPVERFLGEGNGGEQALGECRGVHPRIGPERPGESMDVLAEDDPRVSPGPRKGGLRHGGGRLRQRPGNPCPFGDGAAGEDHVVPRVPVRDRKDVDAVEMLPPLLKGSCSGQKTVPESLSVKKSNFHPQGSEHLPCTLSADGSGHRARTPFRSHLPGIRRIHRIRPHCALLFRHIRPVRLHGQGETRSMSLFRAHFPRQRKRRANAKTCLVRRTELPSHATGLTAVFCIIAFFAPPCHLPVTWGSECS